MTYDQARMLLPVMRQWLAYYGDPTQPGHETWYRGEDGHRYVVRALPWGEYTVYGIVS